MTIDTQIKVGMDAEGVVIGSKKVEKSLASIQNQIQRTTASLAGGEKGSRKFYESLAAQRGVSVNSLKPYLDQLDAAKLKASEATKATGDMRGAIETMTPKLAALFSGAAVIGFASKLVSVQREFDVLNSSLITVTGSSANAEREMQWIKEFAKETPFGLAQATQGFVKMKALGLDPTRASLTSFGNTASAMGKDLNQMIEAVADASTGEFERLKEFGIKAKKDGNEVSLTFQGITTTIGNSAAEITGYLEKLGNVEFAGAMAERAKTLDGAISELADTWDELFRTVNSNNTGAIIYDSITLATGAISDAITVLDALSGAADSNGRATGAMAAIQGGIATVFETVAVVGANLKFVLVGIGNEIGGLAAQVGQAAQFNFAGVRAIREQMVADAVAARKEIDATTARILGARNAAKEFASYSTRNASASTDPRRLDSSPTKPPKPLGGGASGDAGKLAKAQLGLDLAGIKADSEALIKAYSSGQRVLDALRAASMVSDGDYFASKRAAMVATNAIEEASLQASITRLEQEKLIGKDKIAIETKLVEASAKLAQTKSDNNVDGVLLGMQETAAGATNDKFFADQLESFNKRENSMVEAIRVSQMSALDIENAAYAERLAALTLFNAMRNEGEASVNGLIEEEKRRHHAFIEADQRERDLLSLGMAGDTADQLYQIMERAGKDQTALGKAIFLATKAIRVAEIIMNTEAAANAAMATTGIFGIPVATLIRAQGYASAGMVAGLAIADASAEGGYDIPEGKNPIVQTHAKEMILPRAQANVIRDMAKDGGKSGAITIVNNTSAKIGKVTEQRLSNGERALIIEEAVAATAAQFSDPNSKTSRAMSRNYATQRSR